jgi:hypothetical protein
MVLPPDYQQVINLLHRLLGTSQYAFRGTTGLIIQGYTMGVQDIDLTGDRGAAEILDRGLANYCLSPVKYSQTSHHRSYFGRYQIDKVVIEIMGEWQIFSQGEWSEIINASPSQITHINSLPVITPQIELRCYALLGRWSAYHKLKKQLL